MKKLFITAAISTMLSISAFADGGKKASTTEVSEKNVSYTALTQFKTDFENAVNPTWKVSSTCQKVTFIDNNIEYTAFYDLRGEYWGVTREVAFSTLSAAVKKQVAKDYADYNVTNVIKYETQNDKEPVVYFINAKKADSEIILSVASDDNVKYFKTVK